MHSQRRTVASVLIVILMMTATSAFAIRRGRLIGKVVDPDGNPIEGVTVTATSKDVPGFNEVEVTDKKGVFKVDFEEINVVYHYRFDKVGYQTMEAEQTWQKDGSERYEFIMYPGESPAVEGVAPATTSSPAVTAFNAGVAAFGANDYAEAVEYFEEAVEHDPEFTRAWGAMSVALVETGQYQEAADAADKALELGSTHEMVYKARWDAYRNLGDEAKAAEAQADLERAGQLAEEAKRVFNEAVALSKQDDYEGAFVKYQQAAEMDPNLELALLGVATTGLKIGRNEEALEAAKTILEDDPNDEEAIRIRYNAALALGREDLIIDSLVSLAVVEPEVAENGLWALAMAAYNDNDLERAKERYGKVLEVNPNRARAHYYLGLMYVSDGANDLAIDHLQKFLTIAPDDPDAATAAELVEFLKSS
jgi:tetratricopeptide (TPR) repeat protein